MDRTISSNFSSSASAFFPDDDDGAAGLLSALGGGGGGGVGVSGGDGVGVGNGGREPRRRRGMPTSCEWRHSRNALWRELKLKSPNNPQNRKVRRVSHVLLVWWWCPRHYIIGMNRPVQALALKHFFRLLGLTSVSSTVH